MKKITNYFSMIFMAVMMLSLTSCDEDAEIAYALNGSWKGICRRNWIIKGIITRRTEQRSPSILVMILEMAIG